jgi:hypothetical protein
VGDEDGNNMEDMSRYEKSAVLPASLGLEDLVSGLLPAASKLIPAVSGIVN